MKKTIVTFISAMGLAITSLSYAGDFGTEAEAKAMLERAVIAMEADQEAALESFTQGADGFKDRDLYVACFEQGTDDGLLTAHGALATLVGKPANLIVDKKGTNLGELMNVDTKGEIQSTEYWWPRPGETEAVEKVSYFTTIGNQNCLVGYYK